jgi:hypothetical protein
MNENQKNRFEVAITKLEPRREEQSALTAVLAIAGATAAFGAQAWTGDPTSRPSCTVASW